MTLTASQKNAISQAARLAPSADNSIPWQYAWLENNALLFINDKARSGSATDTTYILTNLAMGAAAENALLTASTMGLIGVVNYSKDEDEIKVTITFELGSDNETNDFAVNLAQQIELRHSDRRFPFKGEITEDIIANLKDSISDPAHSLKVYNTKTTIKEIVPYIRRAEAVRFKSESLHSELFNTVKFDEVSPDEGMTLDVLGIEAPARPMFRLLRKWSAMNFLNWLGTSKLIAIRSVTLPIINSPGLAMITTPSDSAQNIFNAGRQIQRVWLQATSLGLSVHLYAAPGVLTLAKPELPTELINELSEIEDYLDEITPGTDKAIMFFRLGYKEGTPPRSGRRSLQSLER